MAGAMRTTLAPRIKAEAARELVARAKGSSDKEPLVPAAISTGDEDRTGERLLPSGWDLATFKKTGLVSFQHTRSPHDIGVLPVGKAEDIWADDDALYAVTRFAIDQPAPVGEWARLLYSLLQDGYIKGWSVWFDPFEWTEKDGTKVLRPRGTGWYGPEPGRVYSKMELLEYGPVVIPANPEVETIASISKAFHKASDRIEIAPELFAELEAYRSIVAGTVSARGLLDAIVSRDKEQSREEYLEAMRGLGVEIVGEETKTAPALSKPTDIVRAAYEALGKMLGSGTGNGSGGDGKSRAPADQNRGFPAGSGLIVAAARALPSLERSLKRLKENPSPAAQEE